jgi:hypothetical protein
VSTLVPPPQIVGFDAVDVTVGEAATVTVTVCVPEQLPVVPVTVYVVFDVGATEMLVPGKLPGCHIYVVAPEALSVAEFPEQIAVVPETVTAGMLCTFTRICAVPEQVPFVPVTVYVVAEAGVTLTEDPVKLPGCQLYVVAPVAVSVTGLPKQAVVCEALAVTTGVVFTVTVIISVSEQPPVVPVMVYVVVAAGVTVTELPLRLPGIQL